MKKSKIFKLHLQKGIFCCFTALLLLLGLATEKPSTGVEDENIAVITLDSKKPNPSEDHIERD